MNAIMPTSIGGHYLLSDKAQILLTRLAANTGLLAADYWGDKGTLWYNVIVFQYKMESRV